MYPTLRDIRNRRSPRDERRRWKPEVSANVVWLGVTSFLTDVSSEMVNAVLPLLLFFTLGFSKFELGLWNGAYQSIAVIASLATAWLADRYRRYKEVAGAGYAASAASRIGLLATRASWLPATLFIYGDRVAKGVRTAPRDALISMSSDSRHLGEAFGVHRTFDTAGALGGPILAFLVLSAAPGGYDVVFTTAFWVAVIGVAVFILFVHNPPTTIRRLRSAREVRRVDAKRLLSLPAFRRVVVAGLLLSCFFIADPLLYLTFQQKTSMSLEYFPLLFAGTASVYTLLALPFGRLADRVRPAPVFLFGQFLVVIVDLMVLIRDPGPLALVIMIVALGTSYAASDGVLAALTSGLLPPSMRTTGLAVLGSALAIGGFVASIGYGALWDWYGATTAVHIFLGGFVIVWLIALVLLAPLRRGLSTPAESEDQPRNSVTD